MPHSLGRKYWVTAHPKRGSRTHLIKMGSIFSLIHLTKRGRKKWILVIVSIYIHTMHNEQFLLMWSYYKYAMHVSVKKKKKKTANFNTHMTSAQYLSENGGLNFLKI